MTTQENVPRFSEKEARDLARRYYGLEVEVSMLDSYIDQNLLLKNGSGPTHVLKFANSLVAEDELDLENGVLRHLAHNHAHLPVPRLVAALDGRDMVRVDNRRGRTHFMRLFTYLPGTCLADHPQDPDMLHVLGGFFGELDTAMAAYRHRAATRVLDWDLQYVARLRPLLDQVEDPGRRAVCTMFFQLFDTEVAPKLPLLPRQIIHNDGNDYNVLTGPGGESRITGLIDFGDMVFTNTICELAIVAAYALMGKRDPLAALCSLTRGYHQSRPLNEGELDVLFHLIAMRLVSSVLKSAEARAVRPDNDYLSVSEKGAWDLLHRLVGFHPDVVADRLRLSCGFGAVHAFADPEAILAERSAHLNPTMSLSYNAPLKITRGFRQYLYDNDGRPYLDCVNNVCHVGHSHPHVVRAGARQMALLNTNTRYLHDNLAAYARRLLATFPPELTNVTFVCTGSEANDLAQRMARTHTGRHAMVSLEGAYHGNTSVNIEISPYKYARKGGGGKQNHIFPAIMPDPFRGPYRHGEPDLGPRYAAHVGEALTQAEEVGGAAAFIAESALGCGGQVILPEGYLTEAFRMARAAGAVCIADEVQVGFGRVGSHFWAFATQDVVPDIVTLGKPIGNGHPLAAVITTAEIARSFNTGMEYFNTFGGNPVSCAVGMAVLDVIEQEQLQENAREVGAYLKQGLAALAHPLIGEVRGLGLFLGVELVRDHTTLEPATREAGWIVNQMKERGVLLSTDGPLDNVLKIKPPIVFSHGDADVLLDNLKAVFEQIS